VVISQIKKKVLLAAISALLTVFAFPPYKTGFFIYLSPLLLLYALDDISSKTSFVIGYIWGLVFNLGILYGVFWATIPGTFGILAIMSLLPAIICAIYKFVSARSKVLSYIMWPLLWVAWDYLRTLTQLNFPWADYGYTHSYYLAMIQIAEIFGVYGISLMIHIVNILLFISFKSDVIVVRRRIAFIVAVLLPCAFLVYGLFRLPGEAEDGTLKVAIAQGNVTRDIKWKKGGVEYSLNLFSQMTRQAAGKGADLVIWPETAIPFYLLHEPNKLNRVKKLVDSADVRLLTGTPEYYKVGKNEYIYFNAAVMISPAEDSIPVYEKIKLVPFSERIPFSERFKKLRDIHLGQADFSPGRYMTIFSFDDIKYATVICFESVFPGYCAEFCRKGAQFLVVITNDMWFGPSSLPYQHAQMSIYRAIENRLPLVRCANTGISMFVDRWGRVYNRTKMFERKLIMGTIIPEQSTSIYNRVGDFLPICCIFGSILVIAVVVFMKGRYDGKF